MSPANGPDNLRAVIFCRRGLERERGVPFRVVCAIGLGSVAGIARAFDVAAIKRRSGLNLVVLAALLAIVCADLSMLSKAETERIWLPFTTWLVAACAFLPPRSHRWFLALNVVGALLLNHVILTNW